MRLLQKSFLPLHHSYHFVTNLEILPKLVSEFPPLQLPIRLLHTEGHVGDNLLLGQISFLII